MAIIQNIISTVFNSQNAANTIRDLTNVNKNITRLGQSSASAGRAFSAQAAGLGGLVAAYAGAAATTFALQQAFDALARSARAAQTLEGLTSLATASGESSTILLRNVREITKNQLTLTEAAQQINLSLSAGFNTDQIERLGSVALKASRALGRDLTDAYTRVVRGSAKLETELLDELGIYTRIDPAVRAYADANNRAVTSLTDFERRQAFVNAVITEGERKFRAINTTVPTTSEKIEAFGTKILDIATVIGIFVAERLAPLAEFLTNNVAGSFGVVGLAAGLMAATLQRVTQEALVRFEQAAATMALKVNQSILSATSGFTQLQTTAQTAIAGVSLANKGLINGIGQELKALKEVAQQRRLNTVELQQAQSLLNQRLTRLNDLRRAEIQQILNTRAARAAAAAAGQSTAVFNDQLKAINNRLKTTNSLLTSTTAQLNAVNAAAIAAPARLAAFASGLVTLGALGAASVARLAVGFVGLGGFILSAVSIVSLLSVGFAKLIGKQEEFNAVTKNLSAAIGGFFNKDEIKAYNNTFLSTTAAAIEQAENANDTLKELDTFKIRSKIIGIDIVVEKTKEDLVKEVASILTTVATESEKTFGASLADSFTSAFSILGGLLGTLIPGVGNLVGFAIGSAVGTVIGAVVDQLSEDLPKVTDQATKDLISAVAQERLNLSEGEAIALFDDENLSRALQLLTEQVGATRDLSFAGRLAYETQVQLLIAQARNLDNARALNQLVANTGLSAAEIDRKFGFDRINEFVTSVTTKELAVPVTFKLLNEQELLADIATISSEIDSLINIVNNSPGLAENLGLIDSGSTEQLIELTNQVKDYEAAITAATLTMTMMEASIGFTGQEPGYISLTEQVENYQDSLNNVLIEQENLRSNSAALVGSLTNISENFINLGRSTTEASTSALLATNSLTDLQSSIRAGSLTLENYSQAIVTIDKNIDRFRAQSESARRSINTLTPSIDAFRSQLESLPEDSPIRETLEGAIRAYENLYSTVLDNEREILNLIASRDAVLANAAGIKAQLELSKLLKDSFGSILTQNVDLLNIFSAQGDVLTSNASTEASRFEFLQGVINSNNTALEKRRELEERINRNSAIGSTLAQAILSTSAETYDTFLNTLSVRDRNLSIQFRSAALTSEELVALQNVRDALTIQQNLFLNNLSALTKITSEINKQNDALSERIGILQAQNAVAAAQRSLAQVQLNNSIEQNRAQLAIRSSQAELNTLQIEQNKASGSGNEARKQALELLKSEIELRQTISNIEAETVKTRLQSNLEAAQKTKEAFEEVTSVLDLTGALTGIGAVLATQLELIELERQQAEEKYQNTLETLAIEREIIEAELNAASGAKAASEAIIQKQLDILRQEQSLEAQAVQNTINELRERERILEAQKTLQIAQASAEAAKARADLEALRTQGEQNVSFLQNRAALDQNFLDNLADLLTKLVQASDPTAAAITANKIATDFTKASEDFSAAILQLESRNRVIFGGELADGTRVQGLIFEELENSFAASKEAIQAEIAALETRAETLGRVQELELSNAEAQLRAQQGGGASRLAELQAQLNAIEAQEAQAGAERAKIVAEASKKQAQAIRTFALDIINTVGKFVVAQKQARVNTLLEEEAQLKDILGFQTEALTEAQSAASNALQEEISLREKLKDATESLTQSQTSYLESLGGEGNVRDASKQFIDTLLEQKQVIFDLQRATRSRIAADGRSASLEQIQAQLTDALTLKTSQRIEAEASLEKTQERLAKITKLVSGEIGNFIKSLGNLGSSLSGLSGGGSFGQVFSNLLGFQDAIASFSNIGTTFAAAASRQVAAANTQAQAAATFNNATATLTGSASTSTTGAVASGGAAVTGATAANTASGLTFSSIASTAFAGAGVGSLIGTLTGDVSWASTIGGAIGSTLATVFAGSTFVSSVTAGIASVATSAGFAANAAASIATFATPLVFAAIGALIIGALFGRKKKIPSASISGAVTGEGFETASVTGSNISGENLRALESIPEQVFAGFLSTFEASGLQFQDRANVTIDFYNGEFRKIQTTFSSGLSTTASNIGKSAQDAAEELERQFFRGLGADSFTVDQFTPSRENIQQALRTFGELEDLDQKTRDRFVRGLEFAQEFDGFVRSLLGTSVKVVDIFRVIDSAATSLSENKLNEYNTLLAVTADNLGRNSTQYATVSAAIRSNALSLLGLAETAEGSLVNINELTSELNAGAIAVRNIVAETVALRTTLSGLGSVLSGINIDTAIGQALRTRLNEFVSDFGNSLNLAVDILREPARIVLVDLEKFIVNGVERIRQASGVYEQLLAEQARGFEVDQPSNAEASVSLRNAGKILGNFFKQLFNSVVPESLEVALDESPLESVGDLAFDQLGTLSKAAKNVATATELLGLELEGFISTISDKAQLQVIIDSAESIDEYAGAIARSAAESRLAEINEIERTQATQQFNKISREFTKRLREITGAASGLSIGGEGVSFIDVLEAFGTTEIDQAARNFKSYLDLINSGIDISSNFNSAIDFLNTRFDNGESDSLKFVSALDLLQRVTLETVDSIGELVDAYESTLQQISEAFNQSRQDLIESVSTLGDELVNLIKNVSDQTQEILGIYDDAVKSVTETGNAIFDLRDAAEDAFTAASDAVAEFEKANKLSGKTAAELRAELESVNASIADVLGSASFDIGSFIDLSTLTANRSSIERELKRVSDTEIEYSKLLEDRTTAANDLAFVETSITELSDKLNDTRSTESKLVQETRAAVLDFTTAQEALADITSILTENSFNLNQARIDENNSVIKLSEAIKELNRDTITLDDLVTDILTSADSTLRSAFIDGAISNIASELAGLDETARAAKIDEVTTAAGSAFDSLIPLAESIAQLTDPQTVTNMDSVTNATKSTTDTFEALLGIFNTDTLDPVSSLITEINRFSAIGVEIANVSAFSSELLTLGVQTDATAADVALLVSDLNALETQLQSLSGDSGVESLRETFKGLAQDLQTAWNENVILGLPDVINLSAISVAPDGGLNELRTIATNSSKFAYIKAVGAAGMEQAVFRAEGGYVSGPGTSTSDSIPAQLSNGEYVIKASSVRKLGLGILNDLNASGDLDETLASKGRFGDSIAAHINQAEADLLKMIGGSGTYNPVTGIVEFFGGASSGANAYGGLFAEEEAAYVKKIQDKFPSGNPQMRSSFKANFIDTRKLQDTYFSTVGTPVDLLSKGGNDIMDTAGYDSMQNQMLSSTMILDSLAGKRGLEGVTSQTQGFGVDSYNPPRKKKWWQKLIAGLVAFAVGALTFGAGAPLALAALATAGTGLAINAATAAKASETQGKDLSLLFEGVTAQDLGRGGYDIKNSPINKILANGSTIATGQSDLSTRYSTFLNSMLGGKASQASPTSIVDEYNKKNDKFFDFYMLNDPKIPNFVKQPYTAKNNSTGGLVNALNTSANLLGTNISGQRDSIPAMLEPGEFVLRKAAVERMGLDTAIRLNSTGNVDNDVNVEVNVINNSSPVTPTVQQTRRENGKIIVDVILEDVRNNGPIRQAIRGIK